MSIKFYTDTNPEWDCKLCPRLAEFRAKNQEEHPHFHNAPVPNWYPDAINGGIGAVKMLVVGLAPGLKGANRTGRPFTGDWAGDLLYSGLCAFDFAEGRYEGDAEDTLKLLDCAITNAVRCVPPLNKPIAAEVNVCRDFLTNTINALPNLEVLITLGKISHDSTARALGVPVSQVPFAHNREHKMGRFNVISSYHCSRYNTNTGRLTEAMFLDVLSKARALVPSPS